MTAIEHGDLDAAHKDMVTSIENVLWDLGEIGQAKIKALTDASWEIFTELKDFLGGDDDN